LRIMSKTPAAPLPTNPTAAMALLQRTRMNLPDTLASSADPQAVLVAMDHLGQGDVWRPEVPRILRNVLARAGHEDYVHDNPSYSMNDKLVRAVMDPWSLSSVGVRSLPSRSDSHIRDLAQNHLPLVAQCYERGAQVESVDSVVAVWHLLAHAQDPKVAKQMGVLRDYRDICAAIVEADKPDLVHHIIHVESRIDAAQLKKDAPELLRNATLNGQANLVEHLGTDVAQRDPKLWNHLVTRAEVMERTPEFKQASQQAELARLQHKPVQVTPELRYVSAMRDANRKLGALRPFALQG